MSLISTTKERLRSERSFSGRGAVKVVRSLPRKLWETTQGLAFAGLLVIAMLAFDPKRPQSDEDER